MHERFLKILKIIKEEEIKSIGIFTHQNADPDSIACAIGLKDLLNYFNSTLSINLFAYSISTLSKNILSIKNELFHATLLTKPLDAIFLCDTNNLIQVGKFDFEDDFIDKIVLFIIDHHSYHSFTDKARVSVIHNLSSSSEIIAQIFKNLQVPMTQEIATILLIGIIFDSRRFKHISQDTFKIVQFLIENGGNYDEALSILHQPMQVSEKIARIKGATRLKYYKVNNYIFAISYVSSFESSLARALINLGADFALTIAVQQDYEIRISMRCTSIFSSKNKINLGEIANKITNIFEGSGGGHSTAAGINLFPTDKLPKEIDSIIDYFSNLIMDEFKQSQL